MRYVLIIIAAPALVISVLFFGSPAAQAAQADQQQSQNSD